jgi:hypothetical protein
MYSSAAQITQAHQGVLEREGRTLDPGIMSGALEAEIRRQRIREDEARHAEGYARKPVAPGEFDVWVNEQDWGAP